tara:strand:+ start:59 stop:328 length:270 start_codon:yes stop_codon:yes gene_type:complete
MINSTQAKKNFLNWFVSQEDNMKDLMIEDLLHELIENECSIWSLDEMIKEAENVPEHIVQELKYADRLDDEMRADAEAQDYETFGDNKI